VKVLLDTNVLASAFATRGLCADVVREVIAEHELVCADPVLRELKRVLKQKFGLPAEKVSAALSLLERFEVATASAAPLNVKVRDPDDAAILACAVASGVDVLVTGDKDLLVIGHHGKLLIISPRGFWELLRGKAGKSRI
jgi:putative PIN family toxin of toxin-antitoxin system